MRRHLCLRNQRYIIININKSISINNLNWSSKLAVEKFVSKLHNQHKPKTVKRKIASLKAFFHYLELEELLEINPFHRILIKYKEPFVLPKTIPFSIINKLIQIAYAEIKKSKSDYAKKNALRNAVIIELLFATGMRISELCSLESSCINMNEYIIKIKGKGSKERLIQICNSEVQILLDKYFIAFESETSRDGVLFRNKLGRPLSDQSVRNMLTKYASKAGVSLHITPHMFRHSFATLLLEEDVDIRYIQQMLGHSSITTTQIYTHTSTYKQKSILESKHPRNKMEFDS